MRDAFSDELKAVLGAVLESRGATDVAARADAFEGHPLPAPLEAYVAKIRDCSHRITDADVKGLLEAGYSEDAVFELTVAAALGAGARRLAGALCAVRGGG